MIVVQLFGAFRDYADSDKVSLSIDAPATVETVKQALQTALAAKDDGDLGRLLGMSRIATAKQVLQDNADIPDTGDLAILPPVSGG